LHSEGGSLESVPEIHSLRFLWFSSVRGRSAAATSHIHCSSPLTVIWPLAVTHSLCAAEPFLNIWNSYSCSSHFTPFTTFAKAYIWSHFSITLPAWLGLTNKINLFVAQISLPEFLCMSCLLLLLLLLRTVIELSLGGSSPHTSTDKTNKNKYT